jgi:hypothetical protein
LLPGRLGQLVDSVGGLHDEAARRDQPAGGISAEHQGWAPQAVTTGSWAGDITNPFGQGFLDADQTVLGTVATAHNDDIAGKRSTVYRVQSGRVVGSIKAPLAADVARSVDTAKVVGNTVFYTHTNPPMGDNGAVAAYNLATKKVTYLVGPHSQYAGKATSSAVIDPAY